MTTYQVERFSDIADELPPLWLKHWLRLGPNRDRVKLEPNIREYLAYEAAAVLHIVTARQEGALIGYFFNLIKAEDLHYRSLTRAWTDLFFIDPEAVPPLSLVAKYRKLIAFTRKELRALGVQEHRVSVKLYSDIGRLLEALGYVPQERVYSILLGD